MARGVKVISLNVYMSVGSSQIGSISKIGINTRVNSTSAYPKHCMEPLGRTGNSWHVQAMILREIKQVPSFCSHLQQKLQ